MNRILLPPVEMEPAIFLVTVNALLDLQENNVKMNLSSAPIIPIVKTMEPAIRTPESVIAMIPSSESLANFSGKRV